MMILTSFKEGNVNVRVQALVRLQAPTFLIIAPANVRVLSHIQHLVWYVCVGVNTTGALWCAPNEPSETSLKRWS